MKVYLFQRRFAALVEQGKKRTTIRSKRKRPTKVGDWLSLRFWLGKPYRSTQARLMIDGKAFVQCKETHEFELNRNRETDEIAMLIDHMRVHNPMRDQVAMEDGFKDFQEMVLWFEINHHFCAHVPFKGDLIKW